MSLVSCILPVYNGERYLAEAIQSVLAQSLTDFELIVVDDGSVDRSPEIVAELARRDDRVVSLRQVNAGIVAALNAGARVAKGRYLARMDADDVCLPHRFAMQAKHLESNPACVLVGGLAQGFSEEGLQGVSSGGRHRRTDLAAFPPKVAVAVHPLIMMRKAAFDRAGGYRDLFPHAEDYDLFIRIGRFGSIDNPDDIILHYRRHPEAVSLRHLEVQERNAALAEACAAVERKIGRASAANTDVEAIALEFWPSWLLESYVAFRIWRRRMGLPRSEITQVYRELLTLAFNTDVRALLSRRYFGLRVRILGSIVKSLITG